MITRIRKAVLPVAGLGTRFLPVTKANPKEMLPIVDKPLIQYAAEEAVAAGITQLVFVTSSSKHAIENHFDSNFELESKLAESGKNEWLEVVRNILPAGISCVSQIISCLPEFRFSAISVLTSFPDWSNILRLIKVGLEIVKAILVEEIKGFG